MITYSFSVLRYIYDIVTAEFVNVGVAVYSGDASFLKAKCTIQYGRITRVFDRIDGDRFRQMLRYIEEEITRLGHRLNQQNLAFAEFPTNIEGLLKRILPPDDSALQFSPVGFGVSPDLNNTLAELYERYVERYTIGQEVASRSDEDVWRVFRDPLERRSVLSILIPKRISTPDYEYQFRAAWKNEAWHVYEPVSLDLVEPISLLEKANRWAGRSMNLAESVEPFRMHLLIGEPHDARLEPTFVKAQNILRKMPGNPELILESDAESFAADLEREMALHGGGTQRVLDLL
jgi:hypothetical protein